MFWAANEFGPTAFIGTELPLPIGAEGEAIGSATFSSGDLVVVGNVSFQGATWGSFWRRPAMGNWGAPALLCQDAERSWVSDACYTSGHATFDASFLVAGTAFEGGRWLAVLHVINPTDVVTIDLPSPPGSNAAALGLTCEGAMVWVAGRVTDRQGRMHPVVWANTPQGWATLPIDLPDGIQGEATDVVKTGLGTLAVCGNAMRAGRMLGFRIEDVTDNSSTAAKFLRPLDGYEDSSANTLIASTFGRGTFGISMNPGGPPVATGWLGDSPFPAQQLLQEPGSVAEIRVFNNTYQGTTTVGQIVGTPGGQPQACVFRATNTHVPDAIRVPVGAILDQLQGGPGIDSLWHRDDNKLRVRTERAGGMQKAVVDLDFTPPFPSFMPGSIQYNLIARAASFTFANLGPGTYVVGGTLNVYAFNFANQTWVPAGSFPVTFTQDQFFQGDFNNDGFIDLQSGEVRLRLEFIPDGNQPAVLVCDMARILVIIHGGG
jgi:hypothetical protein